MYLSVYLFNILIVRPGVRFPILGPKAIFTIQFLSSGDEDISSQTNATFFINLNLNV